MEKIICKSCGAPNEVEAQSGDWFCEYCGNPIELSADRAKFRDLFSKADDAWDRKDFDEALKLYERIVAQDNSQAEAHWSAALCRYGVAYVVDPLRGNKIPTCNRINRTSILEDKNYLAAMRHASDRNKVSYERRAREIDRISANFLKIVDKEKPYDVFISYKKTADDGKLTLDSQYARQLYYYLTEKGVKVFFAEETLMDVAGNMYEPYIFAALTSAKVMLLLGSRREHFEAVWVKNEWKRFLLLSESDPVKTLIPVCIKCKPEEALPMGLGTYQALDGDDFNLKERVYDIVKRKQGTASVAASQPGGRDVLTEMAERYATKENVARVMEVLDCEEKDAIETLIVKKGDIKATINSIGLDPEYKKHSWNCTECGTRNAHDVCRKCGITHADVIKLTKMREEAQRREAEQKRREEEARRREAERAEEARRKEYARSEAAKQAKAAEKRRKAQKRKAAFGKFVKTLVVLAIIVGIGFGAVALYQNVIKPAMWANEEADSLYTPEILKTYVGKYSVRYGSSGQILIAFTECDQQGAVKGYIEFFADEEAYGKYYINGQIDIKFNSGKLDMTIEPGEWVLRPESYDPLDTFQVEINKDHTELKCSSYNMYLDVSDGYDDIQDLNTPEIVQTYCATRDGNELIFTILDCTDSGKVTASWETVYSNGGYLKVNLIGNVISKKENGIVVIGWTSNEIEANSNNINWNDELSMVITDYTTALSNYGQTFTAGENDRFSIKTVDDLQKLVNANGYYVLKNDIDLAGVEWTPIEGFTGKLNGGGHSIKNLTINATTGNIGFFGTLSGIVENLVFENAQITVTGRNENVGILCGSLTGSLKDITTYGKVSAPTGKNVAGIAGKVAVKDTAYTLSGLRNEAEVQGEENVGGILGYFDNTRDYRDTSNYLKNLSNNGAVTAEGNCVGGIVGTINAPDEYVYISGAENTGAITGQQYVGGIVGHMDAARNYSEAKETDSYIVGSTCAAAITGKAYVGCIAGYANDILIRQCVNQGSTLTATGYVLENGIKNVYAGGFAGYGCYASDCSNEVDINYTGNGNYVGGIFGYAGAYRKVVSYSDLANNAQITGASYVGGIFGYYTNPGNYDTTNNQFDSIVNTGTVTGTGDYVGGIMGYMLTENEKVYISNLSNTGDVTGSVYVGGIVGYVVGNASYDKAAETDSYIQDSSCSADISGKAYVGCIAGYAMSMVITDCSNSGSNLYASGYVMEDGNKNAYVGGFAGFGSYAQNCVNEVDIHYTAGGNYVGGILGYAKLHRKTVVISGLENNASISGASHVGGIFGYYINPGNYDTTTNQIDNCKNTGNVSGSGNYVGGLFGMADLKDEYLYIIGCENTASINGYSYVGGLCGSAKGKSGSYISDCVATGSVTASTANKGSNAGELVGVVIE